MLPVFEANNALLFYPVQYEGLEASHEHLLHRRHDQPADHPGAGLPQGRAGHRRRSSSSAPTTSSRARPTRSSSSLRRGARHRGPRRGVRSRSARTEFADDRQQGARRRAPTPCSTPSTATPTSPSSRSTTTRPDRRDDAGRLGLDRRGGGPRHRRRNLAASTPPGTTTRPSRARPTRSSSRLQGQLRRRRGDLRPDGGGLHLAVPVEGHGREGRVLRGRRRHGRSGRRQLRRARGHGDGQRGQPPHRQDRADRPGQRRRTDRRRLVLGRPIEPDPFLEGYHWAASIEKDQTYC